MAFKTFTSGAVLTAAEINTYLMQQAVIVCTAATRPSSPVEGMRIVETDTDLEYIYNGSAWVAIGNFGTWESWTPALTASSVNPTMGSGSTTTGQYVKLGRLVIAQASLVFGTGAAAGTGTYRISLPVDAASTASTVIPLGWVQCYDNSAGAVATLPLERLSASTCQANYGAAWPSGASTTMSATAPWTWADSDQLKIFLTYEGTS